MNLCDIGWDEWFEERFMDYRNQGLSAARITREELQVYEACGEDGYISVSVRGRMMLGSSRQDFPAVGDWVAYRPVPEEKKGVIHAVLPRKNSFSRKTAGAMTSQQIVAANVDTAFIISALEGDRGFSTRRIERYLVLARHGGIETVIVLNKTDLCEDAEKILSETKECFPGMPVFGISGKFGSGLRELDPYLGHGRTVAFLGSSGAGKSTLVNALAGTEIRKTGDVRTDDGRGRHVTTSREMVVLNDQTVVIDTPGMRELQMWAGESDLDGSFSDIEILATKCRFRDCKHISEPGCAVLQALNGGELTEDRMKGYKKLQREISYLEKRQKDKERRSQKTRSVKSNRWSWNRNSEDG